MRIALVFDKLRDDTIGIYFERACQALGVGYEHFWTRDANSIPAVYDLYLRIDHGDYQHDLPDRLHPRIFYATDTHLPNSWRCIRQLARHYDLICCVHRDGAKRLPDSVWVPVACDPALHQVPSMPRHWDVAFVGTEGGVPRKFYLQALRERYPNSFIGHAPHTDLGRFYGQAKIGFNYSIRHDINMRMFEILCAGALLVTNRLPHDNMESLGFLERIHYVTYQRPQELFALVDYYLSHDRERGAIAQQGKAHAQRHHTYRHRLQQILKLAEERLGVRAIPTAKPEVASPCAS